MSLRFPELEIMRTFSNQQIHKLLEKSLEKNVSFFVVGILREYRSCNHLLDSPTQNTTNGTSVVHLYRIMDQKYTKKVQR